MKNGPITAESASLTGNEPHRQASSKVGLVCPRWLLAGITIIVPYPTPSLPHIRQQHHNHHTNTFQSLSYIPAN